VGSNAQIAGLATVADITRARLSAVAAQVGGGLDEPLGG
jgi:adenine-specific DNA-methyltransferase